MRSSEQIAATVLEELRGMSLGMRALDGLLENGNSDMVREKLEAPISAHLRDDVAAGYPMTYSARLSALYERRDQVLGRLEQLSVQYRAQRAMEDRAHENGKLYAFGLVREGWSIEAVEDDANRKMEEAEHPLSVAHAEGQIEGCRIEREEPPAPDLTPEQQEAIAREGESMERLEAGTGRPLDY